jgi:hypothetical protein
MRRRPAHPRAALLVIVPLVLLSAACGQGVAPRAATAGPTTTVASPPTSGGDGSVTYGDRRAYLPDLPTAMHAIFRARATTTSRMTKGPTPPYDLKVTTVHVSEVLKGDRSLAGTDVEVVQYVGDPNSVPAIQAGQEYVLFMYNGTPDSPPFSIHGAFVFGKDGTLTDTDPLRIFLGDEKTVSLARIRSTIH